MIKGLGWPIEKYGLTGRWMGRLDSESVAFRELPVSLPLRRFSGLIRKPWTPHERAGPSAECHCPCGFRVFL